MTTDGLSLEAKESDVSSLLLISLLPVNQFSLLDVPLLKLRPIMELLQLVPPVLQARIVCILIETLLKFVFLDTITQAQQRRLSDASLAL